MSLNKVKPGIFSDTSTDVKWSFRPLLVWMRLISIDLLDYRDDIPSRDVSIWRWISRFYCYFAWLSTTTLVILLFYFGFQGMISEDWSQISTWNWAIDLANIGSHSLAVHTVATFVIAKRWNDLRQCMATTQSLLLPESDVKIRKLSILAVVYIISLDFGLLVIMLTWILSVISSVSTCLIGLTVITKIYASSHVFLFSLLCLTISGKIEGIRHQVKCFFSTSQFTYCHPDTFVRNLRSLYSQVNDSIGFMSRCFGWFLLFEIPFIFIGVINSSMNLVLSAKESDWESKIFSSVFYINHVINLTCMCLSSQSINTETRALATALFRLPDGNPNLKLEIQIFTNELHHSVSYVDALGFFDVGKHLIPKLIGTTLTYLLIMVQFYIQPSTTPTTTESSTLTTYFPVAD